ncbi:TRAP transporter small permease [Limnohabitans sp.]|jgi:TRAP-type C4-dicarboxylate transport system permease small subunit|uniref:TRAP transporter small permease n=1 Tax=Limnohabitans sp. TaxID=1907725 RepID=UPI002FDD7B4D
MNLIERAISLLCQVLLWISTVVIFAILASNTILRYATGASLQWANEVPELLFPWLVMSGVVMAALHGAHITTGFLMDKMPGHARRLWGVLGWAVVCVLYGTLTLATWRMLDIVHDEKSPILQIPGSITYACVMVGMALLAVLAVISAWRAWIADPNASMSTEPAPVHW